MCSSGYGYGQVVDSCKQDKEPSNDIKFGEFLDGLKTFQLLKKFCVPWNYLLRKWCQYKAMTYRNLGSRCTTLKATASKCYKKYI